MRVRKTGVGRKAGMTRGLLALALLVGVALSIAPVRADADPVGHWTLDEASGTRVDSVGSNDLLEVGSVGSVAGEIGNAANFPSTGGNKVLTVADNPELSVGGETSFTIDLRVKLHQRTSTQVFVGKYGGTGEYAVYYEHAFQRFVFSTYSSSGSNDYVLANTIGVPALDTWYHITATHDAAANTNSITVNGQQDTASYTTEPADTSAAFTVGAFNSSGSLYPAFAAIDDLYFWRDAVEQTSQSIAGSETFVGLLNTPIAIDDIQVIAAADTVVPVRLNVTSGTLAMSTTTGLTFDSATSGSTLEFSGTVANVNAALATLTYTRGSVGSDTIEVSLVDPGEVFFAENGHLYEYVSSTQTWGGAQTAAAQREKYGAPGYLATITSQEENDFVADRLENAGWMGAQDITENDWKWTTGPENGISFWSGGISGSPVSDRYANWNTNEPNNSGGNEDCAQFLSGASGKWNDLPCTGTTLPGYVVEYGVDGDLPQVTSHEAAIYTLRDPVLNTPTSETLTNMIDIDFTIYSAPEPGTLKLVFHGANARSINFADLTPGNYTFSLDPSNFLSDANIVSGYPNGTIPDDTYTVFLEYTDAASGYDFRQEINNYTIDTEAPFVESLSPAHESEEVPLGNNLVIDLGGLFEVHAGNIVIYNAANDTVFETIDATGDRVTGSGTDVLTIDPLNEFEQNTQYYVRIDEGVIRDAVGNQPDLTPTETSWVFRTLDILDDDGDGIADTSERDAPNGGDANNDGVADSDQTNVTSFVNEILGEEEYISVELDDSCSVTSATAMAERDAVVNDAGYSYSSGLIDFTADCGTPGYETTVRVYQYGLEWDDFVIRKYNENTRSYATVSDATIEYLVIDGIGAMVATYQVVDGGPLDADGVANGTIVDPVGFAVQDVGVPNTGVGGVHVKMFSFTRY